MCYTRRSVTISRIVRGLSVQELSKAALTGRSQVACFLTDVVARISMLLLFQMITVNWPRISSGIQLNSINILPTKSYQDLIEMAKGFTGTQWSMRRHERPSKPHSRYCMMIGNNLTTTSLWFWERWRQQNRKCTMWWSPLARLLGFTKINLSRYLDVHSIHVGHT